MKKTIFVCVGNAILFLLFGLTFLFPASNIQLNGEAGFSGNLTIFPIILISFLIIYPIIFFVLRKIFKWNKKDASELNFSDERESLIVSKATITTYKVLTGGVQMCIGAIATVRFFALFTHSETNVYFISILSLTMLLVVSSITYCVKWCAEYKK